MKKTVILDAVGKEITPLSIVEMSDPSGHWSSYQGLVVDPNSKIEDDGYTVAVYFFDEVHATNFNHLTPGEGIMNFNTWSEFSSKELKKGNLAFLLKDNAWKRCPRIIFFQPKELVVVKDWKMKALADRLFGNMYHSFHQLSADLPKEPTRYRCFIKGCLNNASSLALYNMWGSVISLYVCDTCMPKVNGICGDDISLKDPITSCLIDA